MKLLIKCSHFQTGEQKVQYNAGVGVVCMYLYERLLFAGCYDGNIYIFDIKVSSKFFKYYLHNTPI